jgi:anti-sigma factor RsiW
MSTDEFALYDAAYVLGALSPADRRDFEEHLKGCAACASSVGELAGLPGLMSKVSEEQLNAQVEAPPATLLPSLARAVRHERARRRLAIGAAAAAAALLIGVGGSVLVRPDSPARPPVATPSSTPSGTVNLAMSAVVPSAITASARLVDVAWGTSIELTCSYDAKGKAPAGGYPYALVVIDRQGVAQQVAAWKAPPGRQLKVTGASSLPRNEIAAVEVRTLSGLALLRLST